MRRTITCPSCNVIIDLVKRKKELNALPVEKSDLHTLISSIFDVQHMRIVFSNRHQMTNETMYATYSDRLYSLELLMKDTADTQTRLYPIHEWIIEQKGLSFDLAGQLIGIIQDINRFDNISKLWSYFGLSVMEVCETCGKRYYPINQKAEKIIHIAERLKEQSDKKIVKDKQDTNNFEEKAKEMLCSCTDPVLKKVSQRKLTGALLDYNPQGKMLAYKVGAQFVKQGDFYRKLYDQYKREYELREDLKLEIDSKKGKVTKKGVSKGTGHIHNMAQRKMVKIFLSHLWTKWREIEGLPVTMPYVIARLGHSDYIAPPDSTQTLKPELKPKHI
jgi:hypothetical protein